MNVEFHCGDAGQFTDLDDFTHFFLYHPFPAVVMAEVMQNIRLSLVRRPRELTLIYVNPVYRETIEAAGIFTESTRHAHPKKGAITYRHRQQDAS